MFMTNRTRRKRRRGFGAKQERREKAETLAAERAKRTPQQQLARLDEKLGEGVGATKERARLQKLIDDGTKQKD